MEKSVNNITDKMYKSPMRLYRAIVKIAYVLTKALFFVNVKGIDNVPKTGSCFVCCNHLSNWDPVFLAVAVKRPMHFMSKKELFSIPVVKNLVSALGAFPVDRENADLTAIKTALTHIKYENMVGIFPQGTRCIGDFPETHGVKNGTGMLVFKTQVDVLPVSIYTKKFRVLPFRKVYVRIGKPISFDDYGKVERSPEEYQRISDIIFNRICSLVNESKKEAEEK